jgi:hypothetical protein
MTSTYDKVLTYTIPSPQASYTFTSIPTTYTDLVMIVSIPSSVTGANSFIRVGNGSIDTGSNYSDTQIYGTGSAAGSTRNSNYGYAYGGVVGANCVSIINFMNYSNTTTYKTILARGNAAGTYVDAVVSLWRSTSAINTIQFQDGGAANLPTGTTLTLYGIKAE